MSTNEYWRRRSTGSTIVVGYLPDRPMPAENSAQNNIESIGVADDTNAPDSYADRENEITGQLEDDVNANVVVRPDADENTDLENDSDTDQDFPIYDDDPMDLDYVPPHLKGEKRKIAFSSDDDPNDKDYVPPRSIKRLNLENQVPYVRPWLPQHTSSQEAASEDAGPEETVSQTPVPQPANKIIVLEEPASPRSLQPTRQVSYYVTTEFVPERSAGKPAVDKSTKSMYVMDDDDVLVEPATDTTWIESPTCDGRIKTMSMRWPDVNWNGRESDETENGEE